MAIDINRRLAFMQAFARYPDMLIAFAKQNCALKNKETGEETPADNGNNLLVMDDYIPRKVAKVCMAQFCVRLIKTRCQNASPALQFFGFETASRYIKYRDEVFPKYHIVADEKYRQAIQTVEQGMSDVIFNALHVEVMAWEAEQDQKIEFDEISFWRDVFLDYVQLQKPSHPNWYEPIGRVILNHMTEFEAALNDDGNFN